MQPYPYLHYRVLMSINKGAINEVLPLFALLMELLLPRRAARVVGAVLRHGHVRRAGSPTVQVLPTKLGWARGL